MKFFVPGTASDSEAESVFASIATFNGVAAPAQRIFSVRYHYKNKDMVATVGMAVDSYYCEPNQLVAAILLTSGAFAICLPSRGVLGGAPISINTSAVSKVEYFT